MPAATFLSLDVEGAESAVLSDSFPFSKYTFLVITVERPKIDLQDRLVAHGYSFLRANAEWGDITFVHRSMPKFAEVMARHNPQHVARARPEVWQRLGYGR